MWELPIKIIICQFNHFPVYIIPNAPAANPVQQSWGAKFCSGNNNSDKSYKHVPEHRKKFNLREDNNHYKSYFILMYNTNLAECFCSKNWKSLECTNAQSNLNKV